MPGLTRRHGWGIHRDDMTPMHPSIVDIGNVQTIRKAVLGVAVGVLIAIFVFGTSRWPEGHDLHEALESIGVGLIVVCIVGRTWCSLYIGGRKSTVLVAEGPYSISRNPLYVLSIIGAAGIGAQLGSFVLTIFAGAIVWLVFRIVVQKEEAHLTTSLGRDYQDYLQRVPRFLPRLSLWHNVEQLNVRPAIVVRTFVDACVFLLAIPAAEMFDWLHASGYIPVLLRLP